MSKKNKKIWKTKKEFNKWMDAYEHQCIHGVTRLHNLDEAVNKLVEQSCLTYAQAFDRVYTIDVLKELGYLDKNFQADGNVISMEDAVTEIVNNFTLMVEKPTNEILLNTEGE